MEGSRADWTPLRRTAPRVRSHASLLSTSVGMVLFLCGAVLMGVDVPDAPPNVQVSFAASLLVGGLLMVLQGEHRWLRRLQHGAFGNLPDWEWDFGWNRRASSGERWRESIHTGVALLLITGFLVPIHLLLLGDRADPLRFLPWLIVGAIDLVVMAGWTHWTHATIRHLSRGNITIRHEQFPIPLKANLTLQLEAPKMKGGTRLSARLVCVAEVMEKISPMDDGPTIYHRPLWEETVEVIPDENGTAELAFRPPPGIPGTDVRADPPTYWELEIRTPPQKDQPTAIIHLPIYTTPDGVVRGKTATKDPD